jgi:hypothetical protein
LSSPLGTAALLLLRTARNEDIRRFLETIPIEKEGVVHLADLLNGAQAPPEEMARMQRPNS